MPKSTLKVLPSRLNPEPASYVSISDDRLIIVFYFDGLASVFHVNVNVLQFSSYSTSSKNPSIMKSSYENDPLHSPFGLQKTICFFCSSTDNCDINLSSAIDDNNLLFKSKVKPST